ncbi:MAG: hypothetical protein M1833_004152 [Piccolia ochrophora]|nr:MAG: hypothetical protein M1833_004152 [Piccolia ochrophora]
MNGTPRSSAELYSVSNNSTETLASDYAQSSNRLLPRGPHVRKPSNLGPTNHDRLPETLMMGYIQIMGSFILDGSLINQAPFEEVKRKGVVGGQGGGGVVGLENKRDSGLFGAFGWGNIGESIGGLLGTGEMSSIKEMRGVANSKTVPLISTPQSVLFVDLRLAPGESKTYSYSFTLPRGLPPSHKGKAMKISYNMVVGVQRPVSAREQQPVTHVDVPFRVFGGVNGRGETLGHDLMSPHIILKDEARTALVDEGPLTPNPRRGSERIPKRDASQAAFDSFNDYISALLTHNDADPTSSLLSPTSNVPRLRHRSSAFEPPTPASSKEAIDLAILRSNITGPSSNFTPNRFEIARSSQRVAVLTLARPAYRLGETITAIIDFDDARIPTYAVYATLETMETVDPAIALRSPASVLRATRKMHAELSETTLYARRVVFAAAIPASATPDFITSGVSMKWKLRVQFVTPRLSALETTLPHEDADGSDDGTEEPSHISSSGGLPLLEEISTDQRGTILAAVEGLSCESFEVAVPVRVYGAVTGGGSGLGTGAGAGVGKEDGGRWGSGGGEGFAV